MIKRMFDLVISLAALFVFSPLLIVLALLIRAQLGSPIFFKQERPGLAGHPFYILKFRTLRNAFAVDDSVLPDADRMTPLGRILRSTSVDELPELWNVLKGEMSLVGPRPLLMEYLPLYSKEQARRHEVRPGITGWAQVNGRNTLNWEDKFKLDVWYVDNWSFFLDVRIIFLTMKKVLMREGINAAGEVTMKKFTGSQF